MRYTWAGATHVGRHRTNNEDAFAPHGDGTGDGPIVVAVADGMGGHVAGEIASRLAIEAAMADPGSAGDRARAGNDKVVEAVISDPALAGMGTTLTLASLTGGNTAEIAHIGDSRAYLLRERGLRQLTQDHTLVAELVADGKLDPAEVRAHPQRNLLTKVIGMARTVDIDELSVEVEAGDRLLLCSDGLTSMIEDPEVAEILAQGAPEEAVWNLIEAANRAGGEDNVTVIVVDIAP